MAIVSEQLDFFTIVGSPNILDSVSSAYHVRQRHTGSSWMGNQNGCPASRTQEK
jgi:hypothetical protein